MRNATEDDMPNLKVRLTPEVKVQWVGALRSGEYDQTRNVLAIFQDGEKTKCCCLGVLCLIQNVPNQPSLVVGGARAFNFPGGFTESTMPQLEWFSMMLRSSWDEEMTAPDKVDDTLGNSIMAKLVNMNDQENKSFSEIADWIIQNL